MAFSGKQKKEPKCDNVTSLEILFLYVLNMHFHRKVWRYGVPVFFLLAGHVSELLFVVYNATIRDQAWCTGLQYFYHLRLFRGAANWQPF